MDAELKAKWVTALRSGDYKQGHRALRVDGGNGGYCCLGVLCDILPTVEWEGDRAVAIDSNPEAFESSSGGFLPVATRQALDLDVSTEGSVAAMNDRGESFSDIATWIEQNILVTADGVTTERSDEENI